MNLSLIVDEELGIPLMYDVYPGSIVDVSTLKNTIKKIDAQGNWRLYSNYGPGFLLDGQYRRVSVKQLIVYQFSLQAPSRSVKESISSIHSSIDDPRYLKLHQKEPLFVMPGISMSERFILRDMLTMIKNANRRKEMRSINGYTNWWSVSNL